jgi:hypothetical protein
MAAERTSAGEVLETDGACATTDEHEAIKILGEGP